VLPRQRHARMANLGIVEDFAWPVDRQHRDVPLLEHRDPFAARALLERLGNVFPRDHVLLIVQRQRHV
jgi:hypothetical protein